MQNNSLAPMTPKEIVNELNKHIIGQNDAKKAVAIALRNRWRRMQVDPAMTNEITPKNILMIGPTGVGKTEIARRLARLVNAPFIKVEATKFTEVGYVGRDVESIVRDLVDIAYKMFREQAMDKVMTRAEDLAEERILDVLLPPIPEGKKAKEANDPEAEDAEALKQKREKTKKLFRKKIRDGALDDKEIEIDISAVSMGVEIMGPPGMEEMTSQLQGLFQSMGGERTKKRKMRVKDALKLLREEEAGKLVNDEEIRTLAVEKVEQHGIVFLDEFDKIASRENVGGGDVSREGVQRDLLPLVEGSTVSTKYGMVKTDHILFIASGAFHVSKPSDLIPELQGRFPIRVELKALSTEDFIRILTEPDASLTKQYVALLATEKVTIGFKEDAVTKIANIAWQVNESHENIGARRLHTVMEKLLEDLSYNATEMEGESITIDEAYVNKQLAELVEDQDLRQYIL